MKNVKRIKVRTIEDAERALNGIYQLLSQLPIYIGDGSPENEVVANVPAMYFRLDGGTDTTLYIKESDSEKSSGWVAK